MVKLEEVEDDTYAAQQPGPDDDEGWDTDDSASDVSDISDASEPDAETLADRIYALRDMVPPASRRRIATGYNTTYSWGSWGVQRGLKLTWQVTVSVLLLAVPFGLVMMEDQAIAFEEQQQKFRDMGSEMMTSGADDTAPPELK